MTPTYFASPQHFRRWLERHHATATELLVGFRKVGTGLPSLTWPESVDEALCFGWIDGVRRSVDETAYSIRFTPRRTTSIWSSVNVAKVAVLTAEGRMRPAGIAAFEARSHKRTGIYAFEQTQPVELTPEHLRVFKRHKAAWRYFEAAPRGYRKQMIFRVVSAKRADTQQRRLAQLIEACAAGRRMI